MKRRIVVLIVSACLAGAKDREGFVEVPGGAVWYQVKGAGTGIPLLALHGGPGAMSCHFSPLGQVGDTRPVVVYDQLGSGRSGRPMDESLWTLERFVEEVDAVRRKLGLKKVHLLGHSWGGALAAQYVASKGTKGISSLILISPLLSTKDWTSDADELRRQLPVEVQQVLEKHEKAGTTSSPEYQKAEGEYYSRFVYRKKPAANPECSGSVPNMKIYQQMWGNSEFRATGSLKSFDVTPNLKNFNIPVLLVVGQHDEARPETAARYQKMIPGAKLEVIPDSAHALFSDNPDIAVRVIRSFLATLKN